MLRQIVRELQNARGGVTSRELSRKLQIDPSALEGMLQHLLHKQVIRLAEPNPAGCAGGCAHCGAHCPLAMKKLPRAYVLAKREESQTCLGKNPQESSL